MKIMYFEGLVWGFGAKLLLYKRMLLLATFVQVQTLGSGFIQLPPQKRFEGSRIMQPPTVSVSRSAVVDSTSLVWLCAHSHHWLSAAAALGSP